MHVALVLYPASEDTIELRLHYLHDHITSWCGASSRLATLLHRLVMARLRPLLHVLEALRDAQRDLEACNARDARALGGRPRALLRVVNPQLYQDACTLYFGLLSGFTGGDASSCVSPSGWEACACGARAWGVTCTPPRLSKGRLVRDCLDECVAFCWECAARRA